MRVAILSAGPSLRQTFDPDARTDLRIGVNAAATLFACDWWSCGDGCNFYELRPIGTPHLFTVTDSDAWLKRTEEVKARFASHHVETWGPVGSALNAPDGATTWSITAALMLAVHLGGKSVDVYGHDMVGTVDAAGRNIPARAGNYGRMREHWQSVREWAERRGVTVAEHRPQP
jgi:sugar phosphate isomerase/epimerase